MSSQPELPATLPTTFRAGAGVGLIGDTLMVLLDPINADAAERLWNLISAGAGIDEVLEELSAYGLRRLGSFALARFEGDGVRVVVRGDGVGAVNGAGGDVVVSADGVRTWHEDFVSAASVVELHLGQSIDAPLCFRLSSGVIPADALRRGEAVVDRVVAPALMPDAQEPEVPVAAASDPTASDPTASDDVASPSLVAETPRAEVTLIGDAEGDGITSHDLSDDSDNSEITDSDASSPDDDETADLDPAARPAVADDDEYNPFDEMWGRTQVRSVQAAAVRLAGDDVDPAAVSAIGPHVIASVPDILGHNASPQAVSPSRPADGLHDGKTMTKAELQALRSGAAAPAAAGAPMGGPAVQAAVCPAGHANPPHFTACRRCGQRLISPPSQIARPSLGLLKFSNGVTVSLDRPLLIGRNPRLEGAQLGELPAMVKLDVGQGLSRVHAAVRLEGWQALLEDLNSANGTIVQLPGREARRLHPGEPVLLEHAAVIDLGGEITCVVDCS